MNILYCGDKNIADGLTLSVLSLIGHTREPLNILILTADLATGNRRCVALPEDFAEFLDMRLKVFDPRHSVRLFNVTPLFGAEPPTANLGTRFTPCCMLRLYADLVPDVRTACSTSTTTLFAAAIFRSSTIPTSAARSSRACPTTTAGGSSADA